MHVLITGGAGFIGSHLVEHHLRCGDSVHAVDNLTTGRVENIASFLGDHRFRFDEADILTWGDLEKATIWADRIYHMAAVVGVFKVLEDPIRVLSINIAATERLLRMATTGQWKPQIVIASSSEIYGPTSSDLLREDDILYVRSGARSRWNYAISKLADEAFGLSYARQHDIPVCMARLFNTVGLRQTGRYGMVVPRFIDQALRDEPITIFGGGAQTRSFCDVRDTVAALALLASTPQASGEIVNVGNDREISINDLADLVCQRAGKNSVGRKHMSYAEAYGQQYDDILRRRPSLEKLRALTGFRHRWSLEDSLDEMIAHYRERQDK
ncbi:NAD-dependent epimerase/dehydratase family protein [Extensimonas sp. H3M7-6]|jgi:UDP-glucose 4-epimerase|uniref:NAD-dependent epimerase/dehydratase family protein n=1 Tax=Extensimonas soli TaxID=3031322 RepID=UPI0023DB04BC|nr:NAD-dependent epimerase/dehydratase family protein [Extensimonas sp. H3M7-6]MDF1480751.1 GDP-mannose 4,6-dehydratase [Extensimonas sp. H3M7-6]